MIKRMAAAAAFLMLAGPAWANVEPVEDKVMWACLQTPNVNTDICYLQHLPEDKAAAVARDIAAECEKTKSKDGTDEYVAVCGEVRGYIGRRWSY